eukprot:gb/GFBE01067381.1/.p1 GENE.gb/GFBE01067381.1/~~gb/GFBE01067381.1/.p1  ORF type:complete len:238 (+),score=66.84 gb/GFBE01067381.1/:1-714(+)
MTSSLAMTQRRPLKVLSLAICAAVALALQASILKASSWDLEIIRNWSPAFLGVATKETERSEEFAPELGKQVFLASGVRKKFGAVKVYAVALYLDKGCKLWGAKGLNAKKLLKEAPGKATLQIVITSSLVTQAKLTDALREALWPRLEDEGLDEEEVAKALDEFGAILAAGPPLKKGMRLTFRLEKELLKVSIGKDYASQLKNAVLVRSLLATYVDAKAVSPAFRDAIFSGLAPRKK